MNYKVFFLLKSIFDYFENIIIITYIAFKYKLLRSSRFPETTLKLWNFTPEKYDLTVIPYVEQTLLIDKKRTQCYLSNSRLNFTLYVRSYTVNIVVVYRVD